MYLFKERISVDSCESEGTFMANLPLHDLQSKQGEVESSHSKEKYPRWLYVELAGLCVVMAIIWGLMTIPIILYYIPVTVDPLQSSNGTYLNMDNETAGALECREDFFRDESFFNACVPTCSSWKQDSTEVSTLISLVALVTSAIGFIMSIIILVISAFRYKNMFTFDDSKSTIYVVAFFDRGGLLCSSKNLINSFSDTTIFCVIAGMVEMYNVSATIIWWLMIVVAIFWKILFPFGARKCQTNRRIKYIHIACVLIGTLLPLVPIIIQMVKFARDVNFDKTSFMDGGLGFTITRLPPLSCFAIDSDVLFYTTLIPCVILLAIGSAFILLLYWLIHKRHVFRNVKEYKQSFSIGVPERKLMVLFWVAVVATMINFTTFSEYARRADVFRGELTKYFACEFGGHNPANPCDRERVDLLSPVYVILVLFTRGFPSISNLVFVVNCKGLKSMCLKAQTIITRSSRT